tara:strand:+ start:2104 stop:2853 length:750 start_codon:yes stop_codon:yes gene_type:complete
MRYIVFSFFLIFSCSSKKNIFYLQDSDKISNLYLEPIEYNVTYGDFLKISILSENPDQIYVSKNSNDLRYNQTRENMIYNSFLVNNSGEIEFPQIGKVYVKSMTTTEISRIIQEKLTNNNILINAVVDVKILNKSFTILGEVNNPGKYYFEKPSLNLFEAIGMAGDLTINGVRENLKIIRKNENNFEILNIDLRFSNSMNNDVFFLRSGDIIIVDPNINRVKNAGIIGNSGTLLSLLSFLLSSIILIYR